MAVPAVCQEAMLSEYEQERAALIARNHERLAQLGLAAGGSLMKQVYPALCATGRSRGPRLHKVRSILTSSQGFPKVLVKVKASSREKRKNTHNDGMQAKREAEPLAQSSRQSKRLRGAPIPSDQVIT